MKKNRSNQVRNQDAMLIQKELETKHQKLFDDFVAFSKELTARLRQELAENPTLLGAAEGAEHRSDDSGTFGVESDAVGVVNDILLSTGTDD